MDVLYDEVAVGPRILNSYNFSIFTMTGHGVAVGPRILNSYNDGPKITPNFGVAVGPRILNSYNFRFYVYPD